MAKWLRWWHHGVRSSWKAPRSLLFLSHTSYQMMVVSIMKQLVLSENSCLLLLKKLSDVRVILRRG
jgi:hypothetical protein